MNIQMDQLDIFIQDIESKLEDISSITIKELVSDKQQVLIYITEYKIEKKYIVRLEKLYDTLNNSIEDIFIRKKKRKRSYRYYPELIDAFFNNHIYNKKEFNINKLEAYTDNAIQLRKTNNNFKITNTQSFIKTYISEDTPYNGLLLWHGVGVGKTCGAISIAENFKNKAIEIILPSNTLRQNWKDEIINIKKELHKKNKETMVQCTGTEYTDKIDIDYWKSYLDKTDNDNYDIDNLQLTKRINKLIEEHYSFTTYMTLANSIEKECKYSKKICKSTTRQDIQNCPLKDEYSLDKGRALYYYEQIQYIKNRFSNKVFIMDEIHQTRSNGGLSETDNKKIRPYLEMIARYAEHTHFILLSATPMYNITDEIRWILNLLLWNDGRGGIPSTIFDKKGIQLRTDDIDTKQLLINKSRGYISHLRGENPFTFPIKLSPFISDDREESDYFIPKPLQYIENSTVQSFPDDIDEDTYKEDTSKCIHRIQGIKFLYPDYFSEWQYKKIEEKMLENKRMNLSTINLVTKYSNIIYPAIGDDNEIDDESIGTINESIRQLSYYKYEYTHHYHCMKAPFLQKHSIKIYNIIESIKRSLPIKHTGYTAGDTLDNVEHPGGGIVFIYSKFKEFGVKAVAFALEELGCNRFILNKNPEYTNNNMLIRTRDDGERFCAFNKKKYKDIPDDQKNTFTQARYIYLDGSIDKKMLNHLVKEARGEGVSNRTNHYGENILAILGTKVVEVGLSFFNVRQVHILEAWFHFQEMIQVVGRASRNFSHKNLDKEYRNVMVYLHVGTREDDKNDRIETSDERLYRDSYCKKKHMDIVERILKQNAIDCQLNINGNMFIEEDGETIYYKKGALQMTISDSIRPGPRSLYVGDEDSMKYKCIIDDEYDETVDKSTFKHVNNKENINQSKLLIKKLFKKKHYYELQDILKKVKQDPSFFSHSKDTDVDKNLIVYSALDEIVTRKENIYYKKNEGYLIMRHLSIKESGENKDLAFYIFQPKIITDANIDTYESIHTETFKKEYKTINKLLQSTQNIKLIKIYKTQKKKIFKKIFKKDDTTLPIKYRNSILGKKKKKIYRL